MRDVSLWRSLLGVENTVIERVEFDEDAELLVAHARPTARARSRCGVRPKLSTRSAVERGTTPGHWPEPSRNAAAAGPRQTHRRDQAANVRGR